ncbi:MAG: hypothetical protein AB7V43_00795 [Acidimicrobiia bacterium]
MAFDSRPLPHLWSSVPHRLDDRARAADGLTDVVFAEEVDVSRPRRIGEVLLERGHITEKQLADALVLQDRHHRPIGEIFIEMGWAPLGPVVMAAAEVAKVASSGDRLGELLIRRKLVTPGQVGQGLARSKMTGRMLGEVLIEMGFITPVKLFGVLEHQRAERNDPAA